MKPFGIKIATGAVTVLLGVFAATQAQKDRHENVDESWVAAVPPTLGQPPAPIAEVSDRSKPDITQEPSALSELEESPFQSAPIQLVQHTEAAEASNQSDAAKEVDRPKLSLPTMNLTQLPDAGTDDSIPAPASIAPSWTLPTEKAETETTHGERSMSMPLPGSMHDTEDPVGTPSDARSQAATDGRSIDTGADAGAPNEAVPNTLRSSPESFNPMRDATTTGGPTLPAGIAESPFQPADVAGTETPGFQTPGFQTPGFQTPAFGPSGTDVTAAPDSLEETLPSSADTRSAANGTAADALERPASLPAMSIVTPGLGQPVAMGQPAPTGQAAAYGQAAPTASLPNPASLPNADTQIQPGYPPASFEQAPAASAITINPDRTVASPGDRRLEGIQSPSIVIHKRAPREVKVGKPASFVIHIQNVGAVEALDVKIHDRVPAGMRLVDASPTPVQQGDLLLWQLGAMPAGNERTVTMQLIPEQEGELGSVARVTFEAAASVRTISTRPELKIVQRAPEKVLIGQQLEIELEVSNPGSGEATGVILQEDVPTGLEHPQGNKLDNLIGSLAPGEVRRQILRLRAVAPGMIQNHIRLVGDDGLTADNTVEVEVISPELKVGISGPTKRFLERQATYQLEIANVGSADATNLEVSVRLARGFTFVSTGNQGQYDPSRHAVFWSLAQLPAGGRGSVPLKLLPVEEGEQAIILEARADLGIGAKDERSIVVDSIAELSFQVTSGGGPIEVGSEATYEIRVQNSGSKADTNVTVQLQLPPGLELVSSDADAGTDGRGLVAFQPQAQLPPGGDLAYRVTVRGVAPGTHVVQAIVTSDQSDVPITKEDSTRVYSDQ